MVKRKNKNKADITFFKVIPPSFFYEQLNLRKYNIKVHHHKLDVIILKTMILTKRLAVTGIVWFNGEYI